VKRPRFDAALFEGAIGPFTVLVLQTCDPGISEQNVEWVESLWKDKLGRAWWATT